MTWPGRVLAAAWTVAWLRWRLFRLALRRSADRPSGSAGYHLTEAETPVEGVDYDVGELTPDVVAKLDAARDELLHSVVGPRRRGSGARQRRRTAAVAAATLMTFAALGGAAAALVGGSTGVPSVDRLLGLHEAELSRPDVTQPLGAMGQDFQPGDSESSVVEVPLGSRRLVSASYVSRDGKICSAVTDSGGAPGGELACVAPADLAAELARDDAVVLSAGSHIDSVAVLGFVSGSVTKARGRGPAGTLDFHLGSIWRPGVDGLSEVRPFVALGGPENDGLVDLRDYSIQVMEKGGTDPSSAQ